ncbi:cytochrome c oxidase assembly protein [Pseudarthrobacter sp. P1]|uniref:cytochrome c oxidase assembly protein n=1 Tax=Pseudarthrobacter sp. P1 TaxID=3418418 RepID=UPI003CE76463
MPSTITTPEAAPGPQAQRRSFADGISGPWLLAGAGAAILGLVAALLFSGAAATRNLSDPGALTRWGLPVAQAVCNLSVASVIGALVFAAFILPRELKGRSRTTPRTTAAAPSPEHPAFTRAMTLAAAASGLWTLAAVAVLVFTYSDVAGLPLSGSGDYSRQLVFFMTELPVGQAWLATCIFAAVVTTACFAVRSLAGLALTLVVALIALSPQALVGHSASSADHNGAVNSLLLHIAGVSLWVGGIIALVVVSGTLGKLTGTVLKRFSALAVLAFVVVFASGVVNGAIRIHSWAELFGSTYGQLLMAKTVATVVLGSIGYMHRSWIIPRLEAAPGKSGMAGKSGAKPGAKELGVRRVLWQLVLAELVLMGVTSGIAVALSRSAPPAPADRAESLSPAEVLSGYALPPELTPSRWFSEWRMDWLWLAFALAAAVGYLLGVAKLHRRGDKWPIFRTVCWLLGMAALVYVTSGGPAVYGMVLFSAHMVDHMALMVISPLFIVLGAPVSLALKALTPRTDGSRGIREWILVVVHSKFSALVTHPLFAAANFSGSLVLFYYSGAFDYAMRNHIGHELMIAHFTITGYIFIMSMIGSDPLPRRAPYPLRLLLLLATMAFHAFFGVSLMSSTALLSGDYFGNMGRAWGDPALLDQQTAGGIAWGIGEVPTVAIALGVAIMWSRSDARETKRKDRAAERNNDADLNAYNDMFAQLAQRDAGAPRTGGPAAATPASTTPSQGEKP